MYDKLIQLISRYVKVTDEDISLCKELFEPVLYPRNRIIEETRKRPKYLYFIISGYIRLFYYDGSGNEVTSHINCPPGFITSYHAFIQQTPSEENMESITDCELLRISKLNLDKLYNESIVLKNFSIAIFEQSLVYNENRAKDLATLTAEQRYQKLIKNYPGILYNVPLQYIASFLGMKPESLSRIRKLIIS